ncbi:MAG: aminotransferase class V-fold PLP-dependent enzyme [bacterium]
MIPCQRHLFDIPDNVAYFNCAYLSPLLNSVREAGFRGVERKSHPWQVGPDDFFAESEHARRLFAELIQADAGDVAIIPSVSYGVAVAAANLHCREGEEILVLAEQFPSNYYPWSEIVKRTGARMVQVERPAKGSWTEAVLDSMSERTRVAALPQVHWTDGSFIDLNAVSSKCRQIGADLVLDVTQSIGALPISVKELSPSFLVTAAYKWLLGPYSLGFLYVHPDYQSARPIEFNWLNRKDSENFAGLVHYRDEFQPGARRFDVGERSNFTLMPMVIAGLEQIHEWRVSHIQETLSVMTGHLAEDAKNLGLQIASPAAHAGHILGLRFPRGLPEGILSRLAEENVYVSLRGDAMRISPHLYNNQRDVNQLIDVLKISVFDQK